jgi:CTP:molybdopterin cytidylyltransferase MocA
VIGLVRRRLHHALRVARRAYTPAFAKEGHKVVMCAISAAGAGKTVGEDAARQIFAKRLEYIGLGSAVISLPVEPACTGQLKPCFVVLGYRVAYQRALRMARVVELSFDTAGTKTA